MKILVTGAQGQLGQDIVRLAQEKHDVLGLGRAALDITDGSSVKQVVSDFCPDLIVHTAAYTAVDQAESDIEQAYHVNANGSRNVAMAAASMGAKLCYISTDYVFDGLADTPYGEYDTPHPQTVYGKSKLAGEEFVQTLCPRWFIVRTSWVFGLHGNNFVKTMLQLGQTHDVLKVVQDQVGSPTYTVDLADFLLRLGATEQYGIYHASNQGVCSWFEFAQAIFAAAGMSDRVRVVPCTTADFPRPAPRPKYSVLGNTALRTHGFSPLRPWQAALQTFMQDYVASRCQAGPRDKESYETDLDA